MGTLYLVRHGQASLGADDYDQLSPLGHKQCEQLGAHWNQHRLNFQAAYSGTLRRHAQSMEAIAAGLGASPPCDRLEALNEYDSESLLACLGQQAQAKPTSPEQRLLHFRYLCDALSQWMDGSIVPAGMPSWQEFSGGVRTFLQCIRERHIGQNVLLVSSGGPISTAVAQVMGSEPGVVVGLNMRLRNSAVCEFSFGSKRHSLHTFNTLPHLSAPEYRAWITAV